MKQNAVKPCRLLFAYVTVLLLVSNLWAQRSVQNFNRDWRFAKGGQDEQVLQTTFDDSPWERVRLPHDWAISGPFNPDENGYAGKLPWRGEGWYRKTFPLDRADSGRRVYFDFDGVMAFPRVYINGQLAGQWNYGYMSFRVDATPYVKFGEANVIAVHVDTRNHGTRWYPGAGIYRKVMMTICDSVHLAHWGTYVTTPEVTDGSATIQVRSTIENYLDAETQAILDVMILDPEGNSAATSWLPVGLSAGGATEMHQTLTVKTPQRWDIEAPSLYSVSTTIRIDGKVVDTDRTTFGIRAFKFTADDGFHLNGRRVQLYGVNLHHDHGPLGAAFYPRAMERQLEIMREMGVNAIRTSHNPPAPELLELCDRMGFVVWDEAFDKWDDKADRVRGEPPLEQHGWKQISNLILRDRNHPSIVVWSIGNEIGNQPHDREGKSPERVQFMSDFVRQCDPTRPVGISCHIPSTVDQPILDALDLTGWNYARRYARYRQKYPNKPIIYSESASALSTRGFYELPLPNGKTEYSRQFQVNSYDLNAAAWSDIADAEFQLMEDDAFVAGEFVWTGFDYLGEPTPFNQQARSSYFGIVDLCGIPKDRFYLYRSYWRSDTTTVHILPHWNWNDRVGQKVPVFVYTNGDSAELSLNGKSLGRRTKGSPPDRPVNFAEGRVVIVSSQESSKGNLGTHANDGDNTTRWCASKGGAGQWWQVDLGRVQSVRYLFIEFEKEAKRYGYEVKASADASAWETIASKSTSPFPRWGGPTQAYHDVNTAARHIRIEFTDVENQTWASMKEFGVYPARVESPYYDVTYKYRLRWNDVVYEPGTLKAVAYKNGNRIGDAVVRTSGEPAMLRLTPDRTTLAATGEDLCYVLVEALDEDGTLCPLADNLVHFEIKGPADVAGVGNGNPLSLEAFQARHRKLFHGKAMLILRATEGPGGTIQVQADSDGLTSAQATINSQPE
ncbi:MAG: DUF4982 domain-containing protein [Sedimentisphaerales bacterium]|nr:DUF4982 domain-containing protein [Sedimentisphaerales bacterium]